MSTDYGLRPRRQTLTVYSALAAAFVTAGFLGFTAFEARDWLARRSAAVATARALDIQGPPCREIAATDFQVPGRRAPKAFEFEGVVFARRHGHADCRSVRDDGGRSLSSSHVVCQFTGPGALRVTARDGERYFATDPGQPATVSTEGGVPRCVVGAKFRLENGRLTRG